MWDSAKKPIKIRSVLQSNGLRHFIVNEESEEIYASYLLQQKKSRETNLLPRQSQVNERRENGNTTASLRRSTSFTDWADNNNNNESDFFGIAGSKISNSKKHHAFHPQVNRYMNSYDRKEKDFDIGRYPSWRGDALDLVPVKSPVIKKLISGGASGAAGMDLKGKLRTQEGSPSTTLCSRIMTWIDLEVKRNAGKGRGQGSLPFSTADLDIVNGLNLPGCESESGTSSSTDSTGSYSDNGTSDSGPNTSSSSSVSLPKLVPCWRKDREEGAGSKLKKSVRIADDLPKWGKMKRKLKKKDRSWSLNELYDDTFDKEVMTLNDTRGKARSKQDMSSEDRRNDWSGFEKKETDTFLVCDEKLMGTGKLQVHIFLPQTESSVATGRDVHDGGKNVRSDEKSEPEDSP